MATAALGHQGRYSRIEQRNIEGRVVAVKIFLGNPVDASKEMALHRKLSERVPGVVGLLEEREDPKSLVLEYCSHGSLRMFYAQLPELLPEGSLLEFYRGMIHVVETMHNARYVHRALTADNWLVTEDMQVRLSDFGHTISIPLDKSLKTYSLGHGTGEFTNTIFVNDVTILGSVFLQMATGNFELQRQVITPEVFEQCYSTSRYSAKVKSLVKSLLFYNNGGNQVQVEKTLTEIFELATLGSLEDISVLYPAGANPCTNCFGSDSSVARLPCTHFLCASCRRFEQVEEAYCEFCRRMGATETLSADGYKPPSQVDSFSDLF